MRFQSSLTITSLTLLLFSFALISTDYSDSAASSSATSAAGSSATSSANSSASSSATPAATAATARAFAQSATATSIARTASKQPIQIARPATLDSTAWIASAQHSIESEEYSIRHQPSRHSPQSPNRAQNLRVTYLDDGFALEPRVDTAGHWRLTMRVDEINRGGTPLTADTVVDRCVDGARMDVAYDGFRVEYVNAREGMRQNFIVQRRPDGDSTLSIRIRVDGALPIVAGDDAIAFDGQNIPPNLRYDDLKVWDANGHELAAHAGIGDRQIILAVDDRNATYPVTVDPLSSTSEWDREGNQSGAEFGWSVAGAGDVNGDGYSDVIVGALGYDNGQVNEGRCDVYHGSSVGLSTTAAWSVESNQAFSEFGVSVATAGDVNADGYSDVIVGSYLNDNGQTDEGRAFVYHGSSSGLSTTAAWIGEGNQAGAFYGYSVASAGDVNNDGYADVIVGAVAYDNGQTDEGYAFVYHGSSTGLSLTAAWTAEGGQPSASFGYCVSSAGDENGDGYADVIVGAPEYDNVVVNVGRAFVFNGSSSGLSATSAWIVESGQANALYGFAVCTAGDVNGDGYSEIAVGAPYYDNGQTDEGRVYVYYGSSSGPATSPASIFESDQTGAHHGSSCAFVGDANGDGYAELLVGAPQFDNGQTDEGRAVLYAGSSAGLASTAVWSVEGEQANASLGISVAGAGDVNGDGYADLVAGAPFFDNGETEEGRAYVFNGAGNGLAIAASRTVESNQTNAQFGYSVSGAGDVNGDGYSDVIVGALAYDNGQTDEGRAFVYHGSSSGLASTPSWTAECDQASASFGGSVASAGDVNADGYADVIVGAFLLDDGSTDVGGAFIYHGSATGLSSSSAFTVVGDQASTWFGASVACAGDVNGDGFSDVVVGARSYDNGQSDEGRAFVYYGSTTGAELPAAWIAESDQADAWFGYAVASAGDVNNDGYSDVAVGAIFYDNDQLDEGRVFIYHGSPIGLATTAVTVESNQADARFGLSVASAGDINADGYSDLVVGAPLFDNGQTDEGRAFVYRGSSSGISAASVTTSESNQAGALYGFSTSTAGDVNADGYSDVFVGSYSFDHGHTNEGLTFLYHGSATGLSSASVWSAECDQANAELGRSVACAGDVNGDGYDDLVAGARLFDNIETNEGSAFVYYGNSTSGVRATPSQKRKDLSVPVVNGTRTHSGGAALGMFARTSRGRSDVKLQIEIKRNDSAFSGGGFVESTSWTDVGTSGVELMRVVNRTGGSYKWRARLKYRLSDGALQPYSRWYSPAGSAATEIDYRIAGAAVLAASGWRLISPAFVQDTMSPGRIFSDDFGYTPDVFGFDNGYQSVSTLVMGKGYWVEFPPNGFADIYGDAVDSAQIALSFGWNIVGNPFSFTLPLSQLRFTDGIMTKTLADAAASGWINGQLYGFDSSGYTNVTGSLAVWSGYWLEALRSGLTIKYVKP